jgi:hypothetical protein
LNGTTPKPDYKKTLLLAGIQTVLRFLGVDWNDNNLFGWIPKQKILDFVNRPVGDVSVHDAFEFAHPLFNCIDQVSNETDWKTQLKQVLLKASIDCINGPMACLIFGLCSLDEF